MPLITCPHCGQAIALVKAAAPEPVPTKPASPTPDHWEPVTKTVTCNRCGAEELAWLKSRHGKPYLVQARRLPDGRLGADRREFHECPGPQKASDVDRTMITDADIPF